MKKVLLFLAIGLALSCSKEEDNVILTDSQIILGNWTLVQAGEINRELEITLRELDACSDQLSLTFYENNTVKLNGCFEGEPLIETINWNIQGNVLNLKALEYDINIDTVIMQLTEGTLEIRGEFIGSDPTSYELYTR